jgi:nucleoid-associated protein EbfC
MKLPKNFGGQGFGAMLKQAQEAMAKAQTLNEELAAERIPIDKGPIKMEFNGLGELQKINIDKSVVDPEDIESLEDLIVSAVRDGFQQAVAIREERMQGIMPNIPGM